MKGFRNPEKMSALWVNIICLVIASLGVANAMPPPKNPFGDSIAWPQRSQHRPVTQLMMGSFKVELEETTLGQVIQAAGAGEIAHQGDAGESIYWLCFTGPNERIWIIADGEMGGADHRVGQIAAREVLGAKPKKDCPLLSSRLQPLRLDNSIWLGTARKQATHILGTPSHTDGSWQSYNYAGKVPGECSPKGFDLLNWLLLKTEGGKVVELRAGQVTSC